MSSAHAVKLTFDGGVPGVKLVHSGRCDQTANHDGECILEDWVENVGDELVHGEITVPVEVAWLNDDSPVLTLAAGNGCPHVNAYKDDFLGEWHCDDCGATSDGPPAGSKDQ